MHDCMIQPPDCDPAHAPYCSPSGTTDAAVAAAAAATAETTCTAVGGTWVSDVDNCGLVVAPLYFVAFTILGSFVMVNLIIAVVLENFSTSKKTGGHEVWIGKRGGAGGGGMIPYGWVSRGVLQGCPAQM